MVAHDWRAAMVLRATKSLMSTALSNNLLNVIFTVYLKALWSVGCWGELGLSTVGDQKALVRQETRFGWTGMFIFDENVLNVAGHTDATSASCVAPLMSIPTNLLPAMLIWTPWNFLRTSQRWLKCSSPTYSTPKSSMIRQNWMGRHLWCQRPGVDSAL